MKRLLRKNFIDENKKSKILVDLLDKLKKNDFDKFEKS
jgi:hypothetical protein